MPGTLRARIHEATGFTRLASRNKADRDDEMTKNLAVGKAVEDGSKRVIDKTVRHSNLSAQKMDREKSYGARRTLMAGA